MIFFGSAVLHLSQIAGSVGTRITMFGLAMIAVVIAGLKATGRIAGSQEPEGRAPSRSEAATQGEAARLREQVIRGTRSAWERRDLVARLRMSLRTLDRFVVRTELEAAEDELRLTSLLKAPLHRRPSPAHVKELADSLLNTIEQWEERLHRRPKGGGKCPFHSPTDRRPSPG